MTDSQKKALSDFLNTTAAAWITAGVIAPIFAPGYLRSEFLLSVASGATGAFALLVISLILVKEVKQ